MTHAWEKNWARLPLKTLVNARELGGYPTSSGKQTQYHRFLRTDALSKLSEQDRQFLYNYGVRTVIDLRGSDEVQAAPDVVLGEDVVYKNIPLLGFNLADPEEMQRWANDPDYPAEDVYRSILKNHDAVAECMKFIAHAKDGCVLFHCAVGKDRTGLVAYFLMTLAGCDCWDALSNYTVSRFNLMRDDWFVEAWAQDMSYARRGHLDSRPETLEYSIDFIQRHHGGVEAYLCACGMTHEEIELLRARMLD